MSPVGISTVTSRSSIDRYLVRIMLIIDGTKASHGETLLVLGASNRIGARGGRMTTRVGDEVVGVASKWNYEMFMCSINVI